MAKKKTHSPRLIRRDGSFNVESRGIRGLKWRDLYHSLLTLHGGWVIVLFFLVFIFVNTLFATLYSFGGPGLLDGIDHRNGFPFWVDCFFLSIQTFATIGYGKILPLGWFNNIVTVLESFTSIMMIAVFTGIIFARFSRPTARVLFSNKACISTVDGDRCLYFRMANERFNQIVDVDLTVQSLTTMVTKEGTSYRVPVELELETKKITNFALSFTVFHIINSKSPFYEVSPEELKTKDLQIIVSLRGLDGTTNQNIHARHSYQLEEIVFDHTFIDVMKTTKDGHIEIDLSKIHEIRKIG